MKALANIALSLLLVSCAPFQFAGNTKSGPYIVQSGGFWSKTKGAVQKAENGPIKLEQVIDEQDGVSGPQGVIDGWVTKGIASIISNENVAKDNNATKQAISSDNNATKVKLGEQATGLETTKVTVKNPNLEH